MISRRYQIHSRTEPAKNIWGTKPGDTLICHFSTPHVPAQVILERLLEISIFFDSWPEDTREKILSEVEKNSIRDFFGGGRGRRPIFDEEVKNSVLSRCWGNQTLTGSDSQIQLELARVAPYRTKKIFLVRNAGEKICGGCRFRL